MALRTVRLVPEAEQALARITRSTGLSISGALNRGVLLLGASTPLAAAPAPAPLAAPPAGVRTCGTGTWTAGPAYPMSVLYPAVAYWDVYYRPDLVRQALKIPGE